MRKFSNSSYYSFALKFEAFSVMKLIHKCSKCKHSNYYIFLTIIFTSAKCLWFVRVVFRL